MSDEGVLRARITGLQLASAAVIEARDRAEEAAERLEAERDAARAQACLLMDVVWHQYEHELRAYRVPTMTPRGLVVYPDGDFRFV